MGAFPLHRSSHRHVASPGTHFLQHHSLAWDPLQNWENISSNPMCSEAALIALGIFDLKVWQTNNLLSSACTNKLERDQGN